MPVERYLVMVVRRYGERKEGWRKINERMPGVAICTRKYRSEIAVLGWYRNGTAC
jgi:hypothetical protein